jgi:hypothetical protein
MITQSPQTTIIFKRLKQTDAMLSKRFPFIQKKSPNVS